MTAHQIIIITIKDKIINYDYQIDLVFDKQPTHEQLIEATQFYLTDQEYPQDGALKLLEIVKQAEVPEINNMVSVGNARLYSSTDIIFKITEP